jgi:hypothetical protein
MRNRREIPPKGKPKVAVVVDGETEAWYLTMLNRNGPNAKFQIKPEIPQSSGMDCRYGYDFERNPGSKKRSA